MTDFYVYFHIHSDSDGNPVVFYVGKGRGNRAYTAARRTPMWRNVVAKYGYEVLIQDDGLTELEAFALEKHYISVFGRRLVPGSGGTLINLSEGGDGPANPVQETRDKMSLAHRGKKFSDETRAKMSEAHKGKLVSAETRNKLSAAMKKLYEERGPIKRPSRTGPSKRVQVVVSEKLCQSLHGLVLSESARRGGLVTVSEYIRELIEAHVKTTTNDERARERSSSEAPRG